ncbi:MAG TPA: hypothetical protein VLA34_05735 [Candidatus Krumholzibacterium sp.]|nr:hypothetical protein [Candidatus Krumholzibacterium sp.]
MAKRFIIGALITLVFLSVARRLSRNNPEDLSVSSGGVEIVHTTVFEHVGGGSPVIELGVDSSSDVDVELVYRVPGDGEVSAVDMTTSGDGLWRGRLPDLKKGSKIEYSFLVYPPGSAALRLPESDDSFILLKYKGHVSTFVLISHVVFMFAAFFFVIEAGLWSIPLLRGGVDKKKVAVMIRWLLLMTFIGGWPLGFILNYQRFGVMWEGFPFGYDVTDNKTQVMFFVWAVVALLTWGSFIGKDEEKDRLGAKGMAAAVLVSVMISLAIFLIPHSI